MKQIPTYKTRDGKTHNSLNYAEDHCLANATKELKDLLDTVFKFRIDNTYGIAQGLILYPNTYNALKSILAWMDDSKVSDED